MTWVTEPATTSEKYFLVTSYSKYTRTLTFENLCPAVERAVLSTKVVANFAGTPFADKAAAVVEACAKHGRHYVDVTGEICLHKASFDSSHELCKKTGAIILHGCGYDSVPSDLGAFMASETMMKEFGCKCKAITYFAGKSKGAVSGGTLATGITMSAAAMFSSTAKKYPGFVEAQKLGMCYPLDPPGGHRGPDTNNHGGWPVKYHKIARTWCAPFIMADINAPVVRKSNALLAYRYGPQVSSRVCEGFVNGSCLVVPLLTLIYVYICIYVYMYKCIYVYIHARVCVCARAHVYIVS